MRKISGNTIIIIFACTLFLGAIVFGLYDRDNEILQNKEYLANCEYTLSDDIFTINAGCIQQKRLPKLSLVDIIDKVWNQVEGFSGYYESYSTSFNYYGANPKFMTRGNPYLQGNKESDNLINEAIKHRKKIKITYNELAQYYAEHLSYFVADRDLSGLGKCSRTNYTLAIETLDDYIMNPGNIFNANKELSKIKDYCKGESEEEYLFYGGVCGMVSQLFRVSLLNPNLIITKRFPHTERFVQYYGEVVGGDDAAIYERSKQFEIQNLGNYDIIFKVRNNGNNMELIAISGPTNKWVNISKENIDGRKLAIHLDKTVYSSDKAISYIERIESFDSYYAGKTYELR